VLAALPAFVAAPALHAQPHWRDTAVPFVSGAAWLESLRAGWYAPRSAEFAQASNALAAALQGHCTRPDAAAARAAWRTAMLAWERLVAVAAGPLLTRRSARRIDFQPARPAAIERALREAPRDMAEVGGPAKGLPALEWLLWRGPQDDAGACAYAVRVAQDIAAEADALRADFAKPREWPDEAALAAAYAEAVNQFVGGVEALRWARIGKPLQEGRGRFDRSESKASAEAWKARADALRTLGAWQAPPAPAAAASPVPLEMVLRGRGLNPLADRLRGALLGAQRAVRAAGPSQPAAARSAVQQLGRLKQVLENEVAPALDVPIGFSDADGD
jgi:hypothetical protein